MLAHVLHCVFDLAEAAVRELRRRLGKALRPATSATLVSGAATDLARSTPELVAENALLRQQLIVLARSTTRPRISSPDRALLVLLASRVRTWRQALLIVQRATFLRNHGRETWACDVLQLTDLFFRPVFAFFVVELGSRRVVHVGVTRAPTDAWVAQQLREATPDEAKPRFLIHDHDATYGPAFARVAAASAIEVIRTPIRAPRANAVCERFLGSVRRECVDHLLILGERHLGRVLAEYVGHFNAARPHQGIDQRRPLSPDTMAVATAEPRA